MYEFEISFYATPLNGAPWVFESLSGIKVRAWKREGHLLSKRLSRPEGKDNADEGAIT